MRTETSDVLFVRAGEVSSLAVVQVLVAGVPVLGVQRESDPDPAAACVCAAHGRVGLRIWPKRPPCFKSDNTPLTSKNRRWRQILVQNPLYP